MGAMELCQSIRSASALAAFVALAASTAACSGYEAGIVYPSDLPSVDKQVLTPEGESGAAIALGGFKIGNELCKGIDLHAITSGLSQDDLSRFLEVQGIKIAAKKARGNLYWYDFPNGGSAPNDFVRLRLAVLENPAAAAKDLHDSLLEHGPGWWGVRRANLALLAPRTNLPDAVAFAIKYKLPCWGMFTVTGVDDAYVVPGPYAEL